MESQNLALIGQIVGPGSLALAGMLFVFKGIIRKNIFPTLAPDAAERILSLIIRGTLVVTVLGMGLWAVVELAGSGESNGQSGAVAFVGAVHDSPITIINQGIDQAVLLQVLELARAKDQVSQQALDAASKSLDLTKAQIVAAYRIIEVSDISPEQAIARLSEHFLELHRLRAAVAVQPGESPAIQALRATAKTRWEAADYDGVDAALAEIEGLQSAGMADTRAQRGDAAMAARRFRDAARHFAEAAHLLRDGRAPKHREYLLRQAEALYREGDERGENTAFDEAIAVYRGVLTGIDRRAEGDAWADVQNKLGTALARLGEREAEKARLEAAVAAYEQALLERTRDRVPLAWAMTQNNLGNALWALGAREPGTVRLKQAEAAYLSALEVFSPTEGEYYFQVTTQNLAAVRAEIIRRGG